MAGLERKQPLWEKGPKISSFHLISQQLSGMHLLHSPMKNWSKYCKKRATRAPILPSNISEQKR